MNSDPVFRHLEFFHGDACCPTLSCWEHRQLILNCLFILAYMAARSQGPIDLDTNLQAVAARISFGKTVTVCNIYLPPSVPFFNNFLAHLLFWEILTVTTLCGGVTIVIVEVVSLMRFLMVLEFDIGILGLPVCWPDIMMGNMKCVLHDMIFCAGITTWLRVLSFVSFVYFFTVSTSVCCDFWTTSACWNHPTVFYTGVHNNSKYIM